MDESVKRASADLDSVEAVMPYATGFMASKHLFVAGELGVFEHLADGPLELGVLAAKIGVPVRTIRIVVDAMVVIGLIRRDGTQYQNAPAAQAVLTGRGSRDLRPVLRLFDRILYPSWIELVRSVRTGEAARSALDVENQQILSEGVEAITAPTADALPHCYDFTQHHRLLDLGGGTGSLLCRILQTHKHMTGMLVDTPAVTGIARERIRDAGLGGRAETMAGDILEIELPVGYDVVLIANVLHLMGPEHNKMLLRRARECAVEGGRLLLIDFFTDATHTHPTFAALMAGTFLVGFGEGDVYSEDEVSDWLKQTGWRNLGSQALAGPAKLLIAG